MSFKGAKGALQKKMKPTMKRNILALAAAGAIALTRVMRGRTAEPNRRRPLERAQIGAIREPVKPALMAVADEPASDTGGRTPDETRK